MNKMTPHDVLDAALNSAIIVVDGELHRVNDVEVEERLIHVINEDSLEESSWYPEELLKKQNVKFLKLQEFAEHQLMKNIKLPCYGISLNVENGGGTISSDLEKCDAHDALESLILGHACAGIDVESPAYIEGIETAVDAIANNLD